MKNFITFILWAVTTLIILMLYKFGALKGAVALIVFAYLIVINVVGIMAMWIDKSRAKRSRRRIEEATLFRITAIGGGIGTTAGMRLFRHKTKHRSFVIFLPLMMFSQLGIILATILKLI
ncbi:MAG: DUF1294 domain-containing protein [Candidatus Cohnella colombiensis]|uniref:DUF1294 domain-containing protein n=1 Tax=Candidatus Cohnella colombiensis TaxID=3121368 RepID=A0AA95EXE8_9BACL|nr:MAG: DUF1294 domain-containing protein [Cohnella sp.]